MLPALGARADEMPVRKPGLWEMKMLRTGSPLPEMTMQHCTDETTDKADEHGVLADGEGNLLQARHPEDRDRLCRRFRVQRRRHVDDLAFRHYGRFQFRLYRQVHRRTASAVRAACTTSPSTIEAKWLGACKPDQKPGDIVMPGGFKMNIKDAEKLKDLLPK